MAFVLLAFRVEEADICILGDFDPKEYNSNESSRK